MGNTHLRSNLREKGDLTASFSTLQANNLYFTGSGGLTFGEVWCSGVATEITIGTVNDHYQMPYFQTDGLSNNASPSFGNNEIMITHGGIYRISCSLAVKSVAGGAQVFHFEIKKNNGAVSYENIHAHLKMAGGGTDTGAVTLSGLASLVVDDTVELWVKNDTNNSNMIVEDCNINIVMIGGNF